MDDSLVQESLGVKPYRVKANLAGTHKDIPGAGARRGLAFTRHCHHRYCMVYIAIKGGRGETIHCAKMCAMKGGGGVPKQRWCWQRISLIRAHAPRSKTLSCKGQGAVSQYCVRSGVWPVSGEE